jgi:hypothetical protein
VSHTRSIEDCGTFQLTRGYICRRPLRNLPFAIDYLAHSAVLLDAHTAEQVQQMSQAVEKKVRPVTQFMFERLEDHKDPDTGILSPYFGMCNNCSWYFMIFYG